MTKFLRSLLLLAASLTILGPGISKSDEAKSKPGISKRVPWTTSKITGTPEAPPKYRSERVFPKLSFEQPVTLTDASGTDRLFVCQLAGKILSFKPRQQVEQADLAVDLKAHIPELTRLYGLAFHPEFEKNRFCYISYVTKDKDPNGTHVSRFVVSNTDPPTIDAKSEKLIISWLGGGHNGACLKFGLDGNLFISTGDGAGAFPPDSHHSGQDISDLLASVLRIDVDHADGGKAYSIPKGNPFVDLEGARPEIWSYGHRNPWKMTVDPKNGALWVGDVGWEMWEMIYRVQPGDNYGWSVMEASQVVHPERKQGPTPIVAPTIAHSHTESRSITGGHVYYGERLKELSGAYIYGDYVTGKVWAARHDGTKLQSVEELADTPLAIVCFGVSSDQELYIVGYDGTLHRLVANPAAVANEDFPTKLSETGLFASVADHRVAAGVVPYSINAEPWQDGARSQRFVALPGTESLELHTENNVQVGNLHGEFRYPNDAVLMKTISLPMPAVAGRQQWRRIETQILHRDGDTWRAYSYHWNKAQTDATLFDGEGRDQDFTVAHAETPAKPDTLSWHFASKTECILCHTTRAGTVHAFNVSQLERSHVYHGGSANQLATLQHIGIVPTEAKSSTVMPDLNNEATHLTQRARAYLHVNCAHCHRRGGGGTAAMDLQFQFNLQRTNLLAARPTQGTFGIAGAGVLSMGDPNRSVIVYRMSKLGRGRMPHFGSKAVDIEGVKLIRQWITELPTLAKLQRAEDDTITLLQRNESRLRNLVFQLDASPELTAAVDELLSTTSGALVLLSMLDSKRLGNDARKLVIQKGSTHPDIRVRDLFERFLPADQRSKRLGTTIKPEQILTLKGDIERGRQLFTKAAGVQCRACHKVGSVGKDIGPDLSHIAKKNNRQQLLESILEPSKKIEPKFMTHLIETIDGNVVNGLIVQRSDKEIVIRSADGKQHRIANDDVDVFVPTRKSLMPDLLVKEMTAQELADLLAFLAGLK